MKSEDIGALAKYRIEQSEEALRDASLLLDNGSYRSAANRAYYGMFYAVMALLVTRGKGTSKHSGAISLFDLEFVKTGAFEKDFSRWLHEAFECRQRFDYEEFLAVSEEEASVLLEHAELFVSSAKIHLEKSEETESQ